jgi:hypothetical protein
MPLLTDDRQTTDSQEEGQAIPDLITIGEAARHLEVNPHYVKGLIQGLRIKTHKNGRVTMITPKDFFKLVKEVKGGATAASR